MVAELTIVVVNWNGGELLRRCLRSIAAAPPSVACEVVVVDNASTDGSVAWLASDEAAALTTAAPLRVIRNADNVGFGRANNQAIGATDAPLVMLLNPDTEVRPRALDALIAAVRSDARIAACGPRLVNPDGSLQPSVWPNPPTPWATVVSGLGVWRLIPRRPRGEWLLGRHWDHARRRTVPLLFGAAVLVRRAVFESVGGFDERFHMYAEDNEWCLRVRRAGWSLMFEPAAEIVHHGSHFSLQRWGRHDKLRVQLASDLEFQRLCLPRHHRLANLAAGCLVAGVHTGWRRLRRQSTDDVGLVLDTYWAHLKRAARDRR